MEVEGVQHVDLIHFLYCNMITTVALGNTSITSHNYYFFFWCEQLRSSLLATSKFIIHYC